LISFRLISRMLWEPFDFPGLGSGTDTSS